MRRRVKLWSLLKDKKSDKKIVYGNFVFDTPYFGLIEASENIARSAILKAKNELLQFGQFIKYTGGKLGGRKEYMIMCGVEMVIESADGRDLAENTCKSIAKEFDLDEYHIINNNDIFIFTKNEDDSYTCKLLPPMVHSYMKKKDINAPTENQKVIGDVKNDNEKV